MSKIQIDAEIIVTWSHIIYDLEMLKFSSKEDAIKQILFEKDECWTSFILYAGNDEELLARKALNSIIDEKYKFRRSIEFAKECIILKKNTLLRIPSTSLKVHGISMQTYSSSLSGELMLRLEHIHLSSDKEEEIEILVSGEDVTVDFEEAAKILRDSPEFHEAFEEAKRCRQVYIDKAEKIKMQEKEDRERTFYQQWKFLEKKRQEGEFEKFMQEEVNT